jgi:hypothetical protein
MLDNEILNEMKKTNKLLVLLLTKDFSQTDKITIMNKAGFQPKEIADMIGTSNNVVSVTLNKIKKV